MTKVEVIREVARKASISKWAAELAVNRIRDIIVAEVQHTGRFAMDGIGIFTMRERSAQVRRNPQTGGTVDVPAKRVVKFKPSAYFKKVVEGR